MPRFEEKVGARLRRDPSDLASYYSCSFIKRDSGGGTRIRSSSPPPPPKMVILVQRPFERVLSRGLTVAVYSSLFDRSKSKRMDPSQEQKKNIHIYIYIYTSGTRIYSWWVPVQIVTSLTVLLVLPIRISSPSLSPYSDISARVRICEPDDMS